MNKDAARQLLGRATESLQTYNQNDPVAMAIQEYLQRTQQSDQEIANTSVDQEIEAFKKRNQQTVAVGEEANNPVNQAISEFKNRMQQTANAEDKHYSELILDELAANHGWNHKRYIQDPSGGLFRASVEKNVGGDPTRGHVNPLGTRSVAASFDQTGRYLSMQFDFNEVFDIDCRDRNVQEVAELFNSRVSQWATKTALYKPSLNIGTKDQQLYPREIDSDVMLQALGQATITDVGSENIYIEKDGVSYYAKVMVTERYAVGNHDFTRESVWGDNPVTVVEGVKKLSEIGFDEGHAKQLLAGLDGLESSLDNFKVVEFDTSGDAYDACQIGDVKPGDILHIPSEKVVGVADTWPYAVTANNGALHRVANNVHGDVVRAEAGYKAAQAFAQELNYPTTQVAQEETVNHSEPIMQTEADDERTVRRPPRTALNDSERTNLINLMTAANSKEHQKPNYPTSQPVQEETVNRSEPIMQTEVDDERTVRRPPRTALNDSERTNLIDLMTAANSKEHEAAYEAG